MTRAAPALLFTVAAIALPHGIAAQSITTLFSSNGGGALDGANYFDVQVLHPSGLRIWAFEISTGIAAAGTPLTLHVYTTPGTAVGNQGNPGAWTHVASGPGFAGAIDVPVPVDTEDFTLAPGSYGFALVIDGAAFRYTNGNGTNQSYANADIALQLGSASNVPFSPTFFVPRVWNGTIHYTAPGIWTPTYGPYGSGCAGTSGTPRIAAQPGSAPRIGSTLRVDLTGMPAGGGGAAMLVGTSKTVWSGGPLPHSLAGLGMRGCWLHCDIALAQTVNHAAGSATWSVAIPNDPLLLGSSFYDQAAVLDPGANPLGVVMSNAAEGCIGQ